MARYVVDASVVISLVLEEGHQQVNEFFDSIGDDDELIGPQMLLPECTSVLRRYVFQSAITEEQGTRCLDRVLNLGIEVTTTESQFKNALNLAQILKNKKAYDLQYLAAAQAEEATLLTIDGGLRQAAINFKHPVRFLR